MTQAGLTKAVFGVEPTADYLKPLGELRINNGQTVVLVSNEAVQQNL